MRKRRTKIYYSAGLISIILLPLFCILYLKTNNAFTNYGSLELQTWNGKDFEPEITNFLNTKKFSTVTLTGNISSDEAKLNIAEKEIKKLILSKDSINGIKFHFETKSEYWTFVRVLDILESKKAKFYLPYKNDIWFANPREPKKKIKTFICGTKYSTFFLDERESKTKSLKIIEIVKKYYLPIIVYILMIVFTFRKIINEKKAYSNS
ncbi:hypothetical protein ACEN2I_18925 [Flavobacterium sp. W22_SRS_FK3]|uniref:hypothetical protein n=1 Tax=Flavobacterium sp. W22_SRS_FK3 TaxID=3240275 RepID=UPI003F900121